MDDDSATGSRRSDPIFQNAYFAAWLIGLFVLGISIFGLVRFPHWIWATPIAVSIAGLGVNFRRRTVPSGWTTVLLAVLTLLLVLGAGALAGLAARISH